jgi:hypothetical protein
MRLRPITPVGCRSRSSIGNFERLATREEYGAAVNAAVARLDHAASSPGVDLSRKTGTPRFDISRRAGQLLSLPRIILSHAEHASRPLPVFMKLAIMLGNIPAVQFLFAKFAAQLRSDTRSAESLLSKFLGEGPGFTGNADRQAAVLELPVRYAVAAPQSNDQYEREELIRRRWTETGIKMWNPHVHGAGLAALNIQGRTELLL